jgi:Ca2+-binding EF-hand superfamily protein
MTLLSGPAHAQPQTLATAPEEHHLPGATQLFISPMGQPFRAGPDEPYPVVRWFAQADRDGDGRIDRAEFRADAEAFFRLLDKNHDGVIDGFEISDYEHEVVPEMLGVYRDAPGVPGPSAAARPRDGKGGPKGGRGRREDVGAVLSAGASAYELISVPEPVASADTGLSGRVTLAQFLAAADQRFQQLDAKGQGFLRLSDLPKTPIQQAAERQQADRHRP